MTLLGSFMEYICMMGVFDFGVGFTLFVTCVEGIWCMGLVFVVAVASLVWVDCGIWFVQ